MKDTRQRHHPMFESTHVKGNLLTEGKGRATGATLIPSGVVRIGNSSIIMQEHNNQYKRPNNVCVYIYIAPRSNNVCVWLLHRRSGTRHNAIRPVFEVERTSASCIETINETRQDLSRGSAEPQRKRRLLTFAKVQLNIHRHAVYLPLSRRRHLEARCVRVKPQVRACVRA
jgi:hypothetical protein